MPLLQTPTEAERSFRSKPITDSDGRRTAVPTKAKRRFRGKPNTSDETRSERHGRTARRVSFRGSVGSFTYRMRYVSVGYGVG